jgi:hypothetical protein
VQNALTTALSQRERRKIVKTNWYCRFSAEQEGPFSSRQMRALAKEGRITAETPVRREADERWYAARKVRGLFKKKKSKRRASAVVEPAAGAAGGSPPGDEEIVPAQLAEAAGNAKTNGAAPPPPVNASAATAGVLDGLALVAPPRPRITPALREQRQAQRKLWIAGGLAAAVVILAALSGVVAYRLSRGGAVAADGAVTPQAASSINQGGAASATGAEAAKGTGGTAMEVAKAPVEMAPAVKTGPGNAIIASQKHWTSLAEIGEGVISENVAVQITRLWWAADATGAPVGATAAEEVASKTPGAPQPKRTSGMASFLFVELQLTNLDALPRKYRSWNSVEKDFAIAVDQSNGVLNLVARAQTPGVDRKGEVEVKPGQVVKDILVFAAPLAPPEAVRLLLAKKAISEEGGYLGWEIAKDVWKVAEKGALPVAAPGNSGNSAAMQERVAGGK